MARRKKFDTTKMITTSAQMAAIMIGFPESRVLSVDEDGAGLHVEVETADDGVSCGRCGAAAALEGRAVVVGRPEGLMFGRPLALSWQLRRWRCPSPDCATDVWTEDVPSGSARSDRPEQ